MSQVRGNIGETIGVSIHSEILTQEEIASRNAAARENYLRHNPAFGPTQSIIALELPATPVVEA